MDKGVQGFGGLHMDLAKTGYSLVRTGDLLDSLQKGSIIMEGARSWSASAVASFIKALSSQHPMPPLVFLQSGGGKCLVVDGRHRLTAMLGAFRGRKVLCDNGEECALRIFLNPFTGDFAYAARGKDPEFLGSISRLAFASRLGNASAFAEDFASGLGRSSHISSAWDQEAIDSAVDKLLSLEDIKLPVCVLPRCMEFGEIVRIYRQANASLGYGKELCSREEALASDLMGVGDPSSMRVIELFLADVAGNDEFPAFKQSTCRLIKQASLVTFGKNDARRALAACHGAANELGLCDLALLGKDEREMNASLMRDALNVVGDPEIWNDFTRLFAQSGFVNQVLLPPGRVMDAMYAAYACGRRRSGVSRQALDPLMRKWIFLSCAKDLWNGAVEGLAGLGLPLGDLALMADPQDFIELFRKSLESLEDADFFSAKVPRMISEATDASGMWTAFNAALNILGSKVLFSDKLQREEPHCGSISIPHDGSPLPPKRLTRHHIFPQAYLRKIGDEEYKMRNLMANQTMLESDTNVAIGKSAPAFYSGRYKYLLGKADYNRSCLDNAIPPNFGDMLFRQFLSERGKLMAKTIEKAWAKLSMGMQAPMSGGASCQDSSEPQFEYVDCSRFLA